MNPPCAEAGVGCIISFRFLLSNLQLNLLEIILPLLLLGLHLCLQRLISESPDMKIRELNQCIDYKTITKQLTILTFCIEMSR